MRIRIRDLFNPGFGMEKFGFGIRYKHPGSRTVLTTTVMFILFSWSKYDEDVHPVCEMCALAFLILNSIHRKYFHFQKLCISSKTQGCDLWSFLHVYVDRGECTWGGDRPDGPWHPPDGPWHPRDGPWHSRDGPWHPRDGPLQPRNGPWHPSDGPRRPHGGPWIPPIAADGVGTPVLKGRHSRALVQHFHLARPDGEGGILLAIVLQQWGKN